MEVQRKHVSIDATGKAVGRIATEVATYLRGKHFRAFDPSKDLGDFVTVKNITKVVFTGKKLVQKDYYHHTGYPGGLRKTSMKKLFTTKPEEVLRKAVYGMLPKNKLRGGMIKRLTITK